jgi:hemolysin activation/secretion protein
MSRGGPIRYTAGLLGGGRGWHIARARARWWTGAAVLLAAQATAQVVPPSADPGALQQQRLEEQRRQQEAERLQRAPSGDPLKRAPPAPAVAPAAVDAVRFPVREIRFTTSELLSAEQLQSIARPYEGRKLAFADLLAVAAKVNALYQERGVVTAQAIVPPQDVSGGIVTIRLVEGRVGAINLSGNDSTKDTYITDRIGLRPSELVLLAPLEDDLIRFNRTNDVQLRAELKPGTGFGTSDLNISVQEPPRHELQMFVDNAGGEATGKWRTGLSYVNRSLLGWRDSLSLSTTRASGQEGYGLGYSVPFNRWGGRVGLTWNKDLIDSKFGPLAPLDVTGRSTAVALTLRQPVYVRQDRQLDLVANVQRRSGTSWISGVFLQKTETTDFSIGAEYQASDDSGVWLMGYSTLSGKARVSGVAGDDRYWLGRGSLRRSQNLAPGVSLRLSFNFQHTTSDLLPASQQFFIGGDYSVRGYPVGAHGGDSGYSLSVELHHPLDLGLRGVPMSGFLFLDHGKVRPFRPPGSLLGATDELIGVGWGLNAQLSERVSARLTMAYAPNDLPQKQRDYRIHFQLVASFL